MRSALVLAAVATAACATPGAAGREAPRPFRPWDGERWLGFGVCYGPHRDGQRPGGPGPTREQLREDLALVRGRWDLLRVYGSDGPTPALLELIDEERLPLKVLLGAWIEPEPDAAARERNRAQVEGAIRLANAHPDVVIAVVVGNETQVHWSAHRSPPEVLIGWLREARRATALPVSTADDFLYWLAPESDRVAREVDLVVTHAHPLWNGRTLDEALAWTQQQYAAVAARHPGLPVVLGETGWATRKADAGDQAKLIRGEPGEDPQRTFYGRYEEWVRRERIASTWFEAFDENWKGSPHPDEVEKHWGLFNADRSPKRAMQGR